MGFRFYKLFSECNFFQPSWKKTDLRLFSTVKSTISTNCHGFFEGIIIVLPLYCVLKSSKWKKLFYGRYVRFFSTSSSWGFNWGWSEIIFWEYTLSRTIYMARAEKMEGMIIVSNLVFSSMEIRKTTEDSKHYCSRNKHVFVKPTVFPYLTQLSQWRFDALVSRTIGTSSLSFRLHSNQAVSYFHNWPYFLHSVRCQS